MPLARTAGPLEGFDYEAPNGAASHPALGSERVADEEERPLIARRPSHAARTRSRRLTFDAFAAPDTLYDPPIDKKERRISAYKVSKAKRLGGFSAPWSHFQAGQH